MKDRKEIPCAYLTTKEVAADLGVSKMTVYRMIQDGTLHALRLGAKTYRIPKNSYAAFKNGATYVPPAAAKGSQS